jgi:hypothetical protein
MFGSNVWNIVNQNGMIDENYIPNEIKHKIHLVDNFYYKKDLVSFLGIKNVKKFKRNYDKFTETYEVTWQGEVEYKENIYYTEKAFKSDYHTYSSSDVYLYKKCYTDTDEYVEMFPNIYLCIVENIVNKNTFLLDVNVHKKEGWESTVPHIIDVYKDSIRKKFRANSYFNQIVNNRVVWKNQYDMNTIDYKGNLSDEIFYDNHLQQYINQQIVGGYIGHIFRTFKSDDVIEKYVKSYYKSSEIAKWLCSSNSRHCTDNIEDLSEKEIAEKIKISIDAFLLKTS